MDGLPRLLLPTITWVVGQRRTRKRRTCLGGSRGAAVARVRGCCNGALRDNLRRARSRSDIGGSGSGSGRDGGRCTACNRQCYKGHHPVMIPHSLLLLVLRTLSW